MRHRVSNFDTLNAMLENCHTAPAGRRLKSPNLPDVPETLMGTIVRSERYKLSPNFQLPDTAELVSAANVKKVLHTGKLGALACILELPKTPSFAEAMEGVPHRDLEVYGFRKRQLFYAAGEMTVRYSFASAQQLTELREARHRSDRNEILAGMLHLTVADQPETMGREAWLPSFGLENDIRAMAVSRRHAEVVPYLGGLQFTDTSKEGTTVLTIPGLS